MNPTNHLPDMMTLAKNAATAAMQEVKAVAAGQPAVEEAEVTRRLTLCHRCELFLRPQQRCSQCGCYMKFKSRLRSQSCPVGKW